jgi:hypothetical protein
MLSRIRVIITPVGEGLRFVLNMAFKYIVAYLLKARTVEQEKQPLLGNGSVACNNGVTVGSGVLCGPCRSYITKTSCHYDIHPCGGGV